MAFVARLDRAESRKSGPLLEWRSIPLVVTGGHQVAAEWTATTSRANGLEESTRTDSSRRIVLVASKGTIARTRAVPRPLAAIKLSGSRKDRPLQSLRVTLLLRPVLAAVLEGGDDRSNLTIRLLREMPIPVAPIAEQRRSWRRSRSTSRDSMLRGVARSALSRAEDRSVQATLQGPLPVEMALVTLPPRRAGSRRTLAKASQRNSNAPRRDVDRRTRWDRRPTRLTSTETLSSAYWLAWACWRREHPGAVRDATTEPVAPWAIFPDLLIGVTASGPEAYVLELVLRSRPVLLGVQTIGAVSWQIPSATKSAHCSLESSRSTQQQQNSSREVERAVLHRRRAHEPRLIEAALTPRRRPSRSAILSPPSAASSSRRIRATSRRAYSSSGSPPSGRGSEADTEADGEGAT